jgi:hypothetical protein
MKDLLRMLGASLFYHSLLTLPVFCLLAAMAPETPSHTVEFVDVLLLFFVWCWGSHATAVHNMQGYGLMASILEFPRRIPETLMSIGRKSEPEPKGKEDDAPRNRRERRAKRES